MCSNVKGTSQTTAKKGKCCRNDIKLSSLWSSIWWCSPVWSAWWFCLRWASYLGRYRSQVPQEGPGNASRGLLFSEGRGHSAVTSCQLQQVNVIHHAPVNEQNIELLAKLFSRHPSIHKLYLLVFYMWVNYLNGFFFYWKWYFFLMFVQGIVVHSEQW